MRGGYVSEDDVEAELFGEPHQGTLRYLRDQVERYAPRITDLFNGFFEDSREVYERYNGESALRRIRARARQSMDTFRSDIIRPLHTLEDIQRAKPTMQRLLMALPRSRELKERQAIDGYSDSYHNPYPGRRGFNDPDYMRVIDGIVFDEDRFGVEYDRENDAWVAHQDMFEPNEDEAELDVVQQGDVLSTWAFLEAFYSAKKKDPTDVFNENM